MRSPRLTSVFVLAILGACSDDAPPPATGDHETESTKTPPPTPVTPGHRRMLETLRGIELAQVLDNPFFGHRRLTELESRLERLSDEDPPRQRWKALMALGEAELTRGHEEEGLAHLEQARALLAEAALSQGEVTQTLFLLGVSWLRLAETENCCAQNNADSCILPLEGGALHALPRGSERAMAAFLELLGQAAPDDGRRPVAAWLLNITAMTLGLWPDDVPEEHRVDPAKLRPTASFPRFLNVMPDKGVDTFTMAGGVVLDDFDGDDDIDVVTSSWHTSDHLRYLENDGAGGLTDRSEAAGLAGITGGLNLAQADVDNDGFLDLLVLRGAWLREQGRHPNSLLRNVGGGRFVDVTFEAGLGDVHWPTQVGTFADYDLDGDVDLFIGNEASIGVDAPCQLFRNRGDGTFEDVAEAAGVAGRGYVKGAAWGDYDGDRDPDLYVSTYGPNALLRNEGDGTFTDVTSKAGVQLPRMSFSTWFWDANDDGALDLWVTSYDGLIEKVARWFLGEPATYERPGHYLGDGRGGFTRATDEAGLVEPLLPMGANYGDFDGDGWLDVYLGTGDTNFQNLMPNVAYRNVDGVRFENVTWAGGFGHLQKGHAVALADLDRDGDLDIYEQLGGFFPGDRYHDAIFENPGFSRRWLRVHLVGTESNRAAIGARLEVDVESADGTVRTLHRRVTSGGSFGASPLRPHVGLGEARSIRELRVFWPVTGRWERFADIPLDREIRIVEGTETWAPTGGGR